MIDLSKYDDELDNGVFDILLNGKEYQGWRLHKNLGEAYENIQLEYSDADRVTTLILEKDGLFYRGRYIWSSWGDPSSTVVGPVVEYPVVVKQWLTNEEVSGMQDSLLPREE